MWLTEGPPGLVGLRLLMLSYPIVGAILALVVYFFF